MEATTASQDGGGSRIVSSPGMNNEELWKEVKGWQKKDGRHKKEAGTASERRPVDDRTKRNLFTILSFIFLCKLCTTHILVTNMIIFPTLATLITHTKTHFSFSQFINTFSIDFVTCSVFVSM
ncbi:Protein of unknown function [Gryllus bimaculatus]|nr:Protein of unknown function [Gryllus bimaculatus]